MYSLEINWSGFKSFLDSKKVSPQFVDINDTYHMFASDGSFSVATVLLKTTPPSAEQLDFETNYKSTGNFSQALQYPFAAKTIGTKKLYKRVHGIKSSTSEGENSILFMIPYAWAKFTGIEMLGAESGDTASLYILDSATSPKYGIPNAILNQFGFSVNVAKDFYEHKSEFDADLYTGMQIKLVYSSQSLKTVGFNIILCELK